MLGFRRFLASVVLAISCVVGAQAQERWLPVGDRAILFIPNSFISASMITQDVPFSSLKFEKDEFNSMTYSQAISLGFSLPNVSGEANSKRERRVVYRTLTRWNDEVRDGKTYRVGAGVTMVFYADVTATDGELSLPMLLAKATIEGKQVRAKLSKVGITSDAVDNLLAFPGDFTMDSLGAHNEAWGRIRTVLNNQLQVSPQVVMVKDNSFDTLRNRTIELFALSQIADGKTLGDALKASKDKDSAVMTLITDFYESFADIKDETTKPRMEVIGRAKDILGKFKVTS